VLEAKELTILTSWAEAVAEALTFAPDRIEMMLTGANSSATWRRALRILEPSLELEQASDSIDEVFEP
jgi:hypothetical protein